MLETRQEIDRLQALLDASMVGAGAHLRGIIDEQRRLSAAQVCERLRGMCLLVLGTSTADGRPLVGPVDGYFLQGASSSAQGATRCGCATWRRARP
jgi:hypothetical protein